MECEIVCGLFFFVPTSICEKRDKLIEKDAMQYYGTLIAIVRNPKKSILQVAKKTFLIRLAKILVSQLQSDYQSILRFLFRPEIVEKPIFDILGVTSDCN